MISQETEIGTLCQYNCDPSKKKHVVKYEGFGENINTFTGTLIESELINDPISMGQRISWWGREFFDPINDIESKSTCEHKYVNVSFNQIKMECKYCGHPQ